VIIFKEYVLKIADYIDAEYGDNDMKSLSDDEKSTIYQIMFAHHENNDSINNAANIIIFYLRENRSWMEKNITKTNQE
jgi:hypothetical protein